MQREISQFRIRRLIPFWATFLVFLLFHKTEERVTNFFQVLSNEITGVPVPEVSPGLIVCLLIVPVGAWLSIPILTKRGSDFGYFLAWTFFASMGITGLAHFILPFFVERPYGETLGQASISKDNLKRSENENKTLRYIGSWFSPGSSG